jgi:hypothetical protein
MSLLGFPNPPLGNLKNTTGNSRVEFWVPEVLPYLFRDRPLDHRLPSSRTVRDKALFLINYLISNILF